MKGLRCEEKEGKDSSKVEKRREKGEEEEKWRKEAI